MKAYSKTVRRIEITHMLDFLSAMFDKGHANSMCGHAYSMCYSNCPYTTLRFFKWTSINKQIYD